MGIDAPIAPVLTKDLIGYTNNLIYKEEKLTFFVLYIKQHQIWQACRARRYIGFKFSSALEK